MAGFMDNYDSVENRIDQFFTDHPTGRIITDIVSMDERLIVMRCDIYRNTEELYPAATDFAQERIGTSDITTKSWLEVCSTSAIGRALADLNYAKKKNGKLTRPSAEEMLKTTVSAEHEALIRKVEALYSAEDFAGLGAFRIEMVEAKAPAWLISKIDNYGTLLKNKNA